MSAKILFVLMACCALAAFGQDATPGSQAPVVSDNGVVSATGAAGKPVSPGSLISIFGTGLAAAPATADTVPLSTTLSDSSVTINGTAAPLSYASPTQISAQVPWSVQPGTAAIVVSRPTGVSPTANVQVAATSPGVFTFRAFDGRSLAFAQNADDLQLAWPTNALPGVPSKPVQRGQTLMIYATGLGALDSAPADGDSGGSQPRNAMNTPTVTVGGVPAQVSFAGLASKYVGVDQINIVVPPDAPTGNAIAIQIATADGTSSDQVFIAVQ